MGAKSLVDAGPGDDELADWLRLTETPGVGPATCRALLGAFGLPGAVFAATHEQLIEVVPRAVANALRRSMTATVADLIDRTRRWAHEPGNHVVTLGDPRYPPLLLETADPPTLLYVKGRVELLAKRTLAIVGSRNATAQGKIDAGRFAGALAANGYAVASGLALGIDAAAHEGALAAGEAAGSTIAVIGTGADIVYPSAHRALAHRIAERGALVSELPLGTSASAHQFPRRNRIIAGLSYGVLVIEAAARSGSLITARLAAEAGREVFAVPGSIHSPLSKGSHQLIRQGAKLVESIADVLEELGVSPTAMPTAPPPAMVTETADPILAALGFDPVLADDVALRCRIDSAGLATRLLDLELAGQIVRLPGGRVQRLVA
jgi:DNA processing protein